MVLQEFNLPTKFLQLIMICVTMLRYSILINEGLTIKLWVKMIEAMRHMSPYLFVLVMEYLHRSTIKLHINF